MAEAPFPTPPASLIIQQDKPIENNTPPSTPTTTRQPESTIAASTSKPYESTATNLIYSTEALDTTSAPMLTPPPLKPCRQHCSLSQPCAEPALCIASCCVYQRIHRRPVTSLFYDPLPRDNALPFNITSEDIFQSADSLFEASFAGSQFAESGFPQTSQMTVSGNTGPPASTSQHPTLIQSIPDPPTELPNLQTHSGEVVSPPAPASQQPPVILNVPDSEGFQSINQSPDAFTKSVSDFLEFQSPPPPPPFTGFGSPPGVSSSTTITMNKFHGFPPSQSPDPEDLQGLTSPPIKTNLRQMFREEVDALPPVRPHTLEHRQSSGPTPTPNSSELPATPTILSNSNEVEEEPTTSAREPEPRTSPFSERAPDEWRRSGGRIL